MSSGSREKWQEMLRLGKARFIWRERALLYGLPIGVVVPRLLGWRPSSLAELVAPDSVRGLWIPLIVGVLAGALYGYAEWDHEHHASEQAEKDQRNG